MGTPKNEYETHTEDSGISVFHMWHDCTIPVGGA